MEFKEFDSRDAASAAAADFIEGLLRHRLAEQRRASLIITGGSSPGKCYELLSDRELDWERVDLVLSDERWVPPSHEDSNERLVRKKLLVNSAAAALLAPMYADDTDIESRAEVLNMELKMLPIPFSAALLGMGEDGHFASLFPDASNLDEGLDSQATELCLPIETAASPHPRLSLTLAAISRSDAILLLIFGQSKRDVLDTAVSGDAEYPVSALLRQKQAPVHVFWAA